MPVAKIVKKRNYLNNVRTNCGTSATLTTSMPEDVRSIEEKEDTNILLKPSLAASEILLSS